MLFLLSFNTPNRWFLSRRESLDIAIEAAADPFAVILVLGLTGFFAHKLAGNWQPMYWVAMQDRLFLAFFGLVGLSTLWSVEPVATIRETIVTLFVVFFGLYLVVRFSLRDVLFLSGVAFGIGVIVDLFFVFALPDYGDTFAGWSGTQINKNSLGRLHVLTAIVFLVGARTFRRFRVINYFLAGLSVALVIGSTSSTSLVSLLLALTTTVVAQIFRARKSLFPAVVLSTMLSAVTAVGFATANLGVLTELFGKDVTFTGRTPLWDFTIAESMERPWTGFGWNAFWNGFGSPAHEVWVEFAWTPPHAHNAFIDYALQVGWPGVILFMIMILRASSRSIAYVRDTPGPTGLLPLAIIVFSLLFSLTESGVVGRNGFFLLVTVSVYSVAVARARRQTEMRTGPSLSISESI